MGVPDEPSKVLIQICETADKSVNADTHAVGHADAYAEGHADAHAEGHADTYGT